MENASSNASHLTNNTATNMKSTLGSCSQLYAGYAASQHTMLQKRVQKMMELESVKKTFEKSKGSKRTQVS